MGQNVWPLMFDHAFLVEPSESWSKFESFWPTSFSLHDNDSLQSLHIIRISHAVSPPAKFRTSPIPGVWTCNQWRSKKCIGFPCIWGYLGMNLGWTSSYAIIRWAILMLTIFEMFTRLPEFARWTSLWMLAVWLWWQQQLHALLSSRLTFVSGSNPTSSADIHSLKSFVAVGHFTTCPSFQLAWEEIVEWSICINMPHASAAYSQIAKHMGSMCKCEFAHWRSQGTLLIEPWQGRTAIHMAAW